MDFHHVMESFAEAWVVANTHTPLTEAAEQGLINNGPNNNHGSSNHNPPNHSSNHNQVNHPSNRCQANNSSNQVQAHQTSNQGHTHQPPNHNQNHQSLNQGQTLQSSNQGQILQSSNTSPANLSTTHSPANLSITHSPSNLSITHSPANLSIIHSPANLSTTHSPANLSLTPSPAAHSTNSNSGIHPHLPLTSSQETSKQEIYTVTDSNNLQESQSSVEASGLCIDLKPKVQEAHGKCLPVHCIIEQNTCGQYVELDSYAIVPCETLFSDLVRTALGKLGYSGSQIVGAKGSVHLKKWKPLAFEQINENPEATVSDILGDLTTVASLHIRLYSVPDNSQEWLDVTVRNAVLELLREMSQSKLAKLCPLSQPMLSNIINNRYLGKIGKEKCQEFGAWYLNYRKENPEGTTPEIVPTDRPADGRLTFHPTKELPIMRDWFHSCRNPSKRTLQMYVDILNQGPVRQQERPKIILSTLKNWWKNEKQRERKQQSEDKSPDAIKAKRKKKSDSGATPKIGETENNPQETPNTNPDETPKANNFTLINHSESEGELKGFPRRDSELSESSLASESSLHFQKSTLLDASKSNCKFAFMSPAPQDSDLSRKDILTESRINSQPSEPSKEVPVESPYFHKIHSMCMDPNMHNLFNFSDHPLAIQHNPKVSTETVRTTATDNNNSRMSSEEDVDVGI